MSSSQPSSDEARDCRVRALAFALGCYEQKKHEKAAGHDPDGDTTKEISDESPRTESLHQQ